MDTASVRSYLKIGDSASKLVNLSQKGKLIMWVIDHEDDGMNQFVCDNSIFYLPKCNVMFYF